MRIGILAFVGLILCTLILLYLHDSILKIMYESYRKDWVKIGRPLGFFFNPVGFAAWFDLRRWRASQHFQYRLLFWAPDQLYEDIQGARLLWIYRAVGILSIIFFILFFLYGFEKL